MLFEAVTCSPRDSESDCTPAKLCCQLRRFDYFGGISCESRPEFFRLQPPGCEPRDTSRDHLLAPSLHLKPQARTLHRAQFRCYMSPQFSVPSNVFTTSPRRLALGKNGPKD